MIRESKSFTLSILPVGAHHLAACFAALAFGACETDGSLAVFRPPENDGEETASMNDEDPDADADSSDSGAASRGDGVSSTSTGASTNTSTSTTTSTTSSPGTTGADSGPPPAVEPLIIEAEDATASGPYAGVVSTPFAGVALFANDDSVSASVTFAQVPGVYDVAVTGASSSTVAATAIMQVGAQAGTMLTFRGTSPQVQIVTVTLGAGDAATQTISVTVTADDGTWDLFIDKFEVSSSGD